MSLSVHIWAAISIIIVVAILVVMDWIPTALNHNIASMSVHERLPSTIIHTTLGLSFVILNLLMLKWGILIGAVWYSVVLLAAIRNWWVAYFAGMYWGEITPDIYAHHYAHNLTVLPRFKGNPVVPDVQHILIHIGILSACLHSWASFWCA